LPFASGRLVRAMASAPVGVGARAVVGGGAAGQLGGHAGVLVGGAGGAAANQAAGPPGVPAAAATAAAAALTMAQGLPDSLGCRVAALEQHHRDLLRERQGVAKDLTHKSKRNHRATETARNLWDAQLLDIIAARSAAARANAKATAMPKAKAAASG
jgi:hypothetical protein